jgi:hypothetical protein
MVDDHGRLRQNTLAAVRAQADHAAAGTLSTAPDLFLARRSAITILPIPAAGYKHAA